MLVVQCRPSKARVAESLQSFDIEKSFVNQKVLFLYKNNLLFSEKPSNFPFSMTIQGIGQQNLQGLCEFSVMCAERKKRKKCGAIVVYLLVIRTAFFPHFLLRQRVILSRYEWMQYVIMARQII